MFDRTASKFDLRLVAIATLSLANDHSLIHPVYNLGRGTRRQNKGTARRQRFTGSPTANFIRSILQYVSI